MTPAHPNHATVFLAHHSDDHRLVHAVRRALGRLGIVAWLDVDELEAGLDLDLALPEAIRGCHVTALFLSEAAVRSDWVKDEAREAMALEAESTDDRRVVPVFLGNDPVALVLSDPTFAPFMHPTRPNTVRRIGIAAHDRDPDAIAHKLATSVIRALDWTGSPGLIIDQRGQSGDRHGPPPKETVPRRFFSAAGPVFVFRPDDEPRTPHCTMTGYDWSAWWSEVWWTVSRIRGRMDPERPVRIAGAGQLGMAWALGRALDRSSRTVLHAFARPHGEGDFTNAGQDFLLLPTDGDAACNQERPALGVPQLPPGHAPVVDLLLVPERYLATIADARLNDRAAGAAVWVETGKLVDSAGLHRLIADVVALLTRLNSERRTRHVRVFTGLPFHALPIVAAALTNVVPSLTFMEYRRGHAASPGAVPRSFYEALALA